MLSDDFDLHRGLSVEKKQEEISGFSRRLMNNGEMNDARWSVGSVFPSAIPAKTSERLVRLLRIAN
jgi:hypothetical protein